jgi:signal transduction histidine kinase/ligand-binding sensor domain-containing protein
LTTNKAKIGYIYLLSFVFTLCIKAQEGNFDRYSIAQGLAHTHVLCAFRDSKDILWIGTSGGLNYFDGYTFHFYTTGNNDTTSISNPSVNVIFEDKEGYLWMGTENGLNRFDRKSGNFKRFWHNQRNTSTISNNKVKSIYQDKNGYLWFGTYGGGLNKYDPVKEKFTRFTSDDLKISGHKLDRINCLSEENDSIVFIGTEKGGLYLFNVINHAIETNYYSKLTDGLKDRTINTVFKDKDGIIWIGTWNKGLFEFNVANNELTSVKDIPSGIEGENDINVRAIAEDNDGFLWLALYNGGLVRYSSTSHSYIRYRYQKNNNRSISYNYIWNLLYDHDNNLWICTFGGGFNKLATHQYHLKVYQVPEKYLNKSDDGSVKSLCEDHNGVLWLGTVGSGLFHFEMNSGLFIPFKFSDNPIPKYISVLYEDKDDQLWAGTSSALIKINSKRDKYVFYHNKPGDSTGLNASLTYHIFQDSKGNIWLGTWNSGFIILPYAESKKENPDSAKFIKYMHNESDPSSISSNVVYTVFEDSKKDYWIGTATYFQKFDLTTKRFSNVLKYVISSVIEDKTGNIWATSLGNGLFKFNLDGELIEHFDKENGLPSNTLLGITEDKNGMIWISSNNGISIFNPSQKSFSNFSLTDELMGNSYNLKSIIRLSSGAIAIGGIDGFNLFWPDSLDMHNAFPKVIFTDFKVFNKSIVRENSGESEARVRIPPYEVKELSLKYNDKLLIIEFAALEYNKAKKINYAYWLKGVDKNWIKVNSEHRYANYSNLMPGKYLFEVKATNIQGIWNDAHTDLTLIISPPFWKTIWFRLFVLSIIVLSSYLIVRIRLSTYRRRQKILKQLIKVKTSEITEQNKILENKNIELNYQKEEILSQKNEIIEMTKRIREADENKLNFFTNISNEFRTPLTLIMGPVEHMLENIVSINDVRDHLKVVYRNSLRLLRLINDLLNFRKIDTQSMKILYTKGDLVRFVKDVTDAFKDFSINRKINLQFTSNKESYITWFDSGKLEIVFYNLISNAVKFTSINGNVSVRVVIDENNNTIEFNVEDDGIGIDDNKIDHIFEKFYQIESSNYMNKAGYGIGLSLTKEMIDLLKGSMWKAPGERELPLI